MNRLQKTFNLTISVGIAKVKSEFRSHHDMNRSHQVEMNTYTERALQYAKDVYFSIGDINRRAKHVDMTSFNQYVKEYGFYRLGVLQDFA